MAYHSMYSERQIHESFFKKKLITSFSGCRTWTFRVYCLPPNLFVLKMMGPLWRTATYFLPFGHESWTTRMSSWHESVFMPTRTALAAFDTYSHTLLASVLRIQNKPPAWLHSCRQKSLMSALAWMLFCAGTYWLRSPKNLNFTVTSLYVYIEYLLRTIH